MSENEPLGDLSRIRCGWHHSKNGRLVFICVLGVGLLVSNVLKKPSRPESSPSGVPASVSTTENVQPLTDEKIFDNYKIKIVEDDDYIADDDEIRALARLGYGVIGKKDGGGSIPFAGDGRGKDNEEQK